MQLPKDAVRLSYEEFAEVLRSASEGAISPGGFIVAALAHPEKYAWGEWPRGNYRLGILAEAKAGAEMAYYAWGRPLP